MTKEWFFKNYVRGKKWICYMRNFVSWKIGLWKADGKNVQSFFLQKKFIIANILSFITKLTFFIFEICKPIIKKSLKISLILKIVSFRIWLQKTRLRMLNYEVKHFPVEWVQNKISVKSGRPELGRPVSRFLIT